MKFRNEKGLTLIELLITIAVIAVVAAISVPVVSNVIAASNTNSLNVMQEQVDQFVAEAAESGTVRLSTDGTKLEALIDQNGDGVDEYLVKTFPVDSKYTLTENSGNYTVSVNGVTGGTTAMTDAEYYAANGFYPVRYASQAAGFSDSTGITAILEATPFSFPRQTQTLYSNSGAEPEILQSGSDTILRVFEGDNTVLATWANTSYDVVAKDWRDAMIAAGYRFDVNNTQLLLWQCGDVSATSSASGWWECPNYSWGASNNAARVYALTLRNGYGVTYP